MIYDVVYYVVYYAVYDAACDVVYEVVHNAAYDVDYYELSVPIFKNTIFNFSLLKNTQLFKNIILFNCKRMPVTLN